MSYDAQYDALKEAAERELKPVVEVATEAERHMIVILEALLAEVRLLRGDLKNRAATSRPEDRGGTPGNGENALY